MTLLERLKVLARLDGEPGIAFDDLLFELWAFTLTPKPCAMNNAITKRSTVGRHASLERPRDADEFCLERIGACSHGRVAVTSHIQKRKVRRQIRIRERAGF